MPTNKQYLEVFNDGQNDLYIRDAETAAAVGTEASFEYVDLGLPSGTLWAKMNIGATVPEDHGKYFSRANIEGHEIGDGYHFTENNYQVTTGYTQYNKIIPLDADYDAAIALMDSDWQIPSIDQFQELYNNTTQEHTTINDVSGLLLTSTVEGYEDKSIFLPAGGVFLENSYPNPYNLNTTGSYWAREQIYTSGRYKGKCFDFDKTYIRNSWENSEFYGLNIRAVSVKINPNSLSNRKADKSSTLEGYGITDAYTKTETDAKLQTKSNISHTHDSRYYQQSEVDTMLEGKSDTDHTHDERYYQKTETYNNTEVYNKAEVDEKIDAVNRRYEMSLDGHTLVFNNGPVYVAGHKLVLL